MSLTGKVALVTGASKGIGRATVLRLAREGASVVINYASDPAPAEELVSEIGADRAIAIKADAGNVSEITKLVEQTVERFDKIDILIPCAGCLKFSTLEATTEETFDTTFNLNVKGPFFLCQKAAPHMGPGSHIVLISTSLCALSGVAPPYLPYVSSKGAIEQMTRVMSKDLGRKGIHVNCLAPGPTATELFMRNQTEQTLNFLKSLNPNNRIGEPEEIADGIAFLCGNDSRWVMGQTLRVNGGMA